MGIGYTSSCLKGFSLPGNWLFRYHIVRIRLETGEFGLSCKGSTMGRKLSTGFEKLRWKA